MVRVIKELSIITSISKGFTHSYRGVKHRKSTKKVWFAFGFDYKSRFIKIRISPIQAIFYKRKIKKIRRFICTRCNLKFEGFKDSNPPCPFCELS